MRQLPPEALASELKRIDSETQDGSISKEALWNFMSTGLAGELSESDCNALFAAIDLDQSGTVDFLEFCTFMGKCSDEYRSARTNRGSVTDRASRRISVADTTARRLSSVAQGRTMRWRPQLRQRQRRMPRKERRRATMSRR
jgi:hypothetical protein